MNNIELDIPKEFKTKDVKQLIKHEVSTECYNKSKFHQDTKKLDNELNEILNRTKKGFGEMNADRKIIKKSVIGKVKIFYDSNDKIQGYQYRDTPFMSYDNRKIVLERQKKEEKRLSNV